MSDYLCISIRFLDGAFHGRADYDEPEWPPSPLRVFQAIVAASAARWNERRGVRHAALALRWFEQLKAPVIVTPLLKSLTAKGYRLYVPDNVGDLVGKSWSRGGEASVAGYRTEKTIRPTLFEDNEAVYYLWSLSNAPEGFGKHRDVLFSAIRSITHVGWGVDLVVVDGSILNDAEAAALKGKRYLPTDAETDHSLRVPRQGSFDDLERRHRAFLNRVSGDGFAPVQPLAVYEITSYRAADQPLRSPRAIFSLRQLDDSGFRPFDTARRGLHVAGMLRHAASTAELLRSVGWTEEDARRIVLGHGEGNGQQHQPVQGARLAFLPLPSIEWRGEERKHSVGSIRRVAVTTIGTLDRESFRRFAQQFAGRELIDERLNRPIALLARQLETDGAIKAYFQSAVTWATVTPIILPGYDDPRKLRQKLRLQTAKKLTAEEKSILLQKLDKRIEFLLRKAIRQAGFSDALAQHAELEWRNTGFWPGTELATRYAVPDQNRRHRRLHARISWRDSHGKPVEVAGPICIGGGRFSGLGLLAPVTDSA
jgi:CRISPR-associated protein Csb2